MNVVRSHAVSTSAALFRSEHFFPCSDAIQMIHNPVLSASTQIERYLEVYSVSGTTRLKALQFREPAVSGGACYIPAVQLGAVGTQWTCRAPSVPSGARRTVRKL